MSSRKYPTKGAPVRRKDDGLTGEVFVSSPTTDLVAIRWKNEDETGTLLYDVEQFTREWEPARRGSVKLKAAAVAVVVAICGVGLYAGLRAWEQMRTSRVAAAARQQAGMDGNAPDDEGAQAQRACSRGADEYLRSIGGNGFRWAYGATPDERFNNPAAVHIAPGITTSVSDKLLEENSAGVFKRVELICSYDSSDNKVLRYWIADSDE